MLLQGTAKRTPPLSSPLGVNNMNILSKIFRQKSECNLNKCDYCDLQRTIQPITGLQVKQTDQWFSDINCLYKANLIPHKYSKAILIPEDTTSYCLINSKYWHKKKKHVKCPFWQATVGSSPSSAMSLHHSRQTKKMTKAIYILTAVMAFYAVLSIFQIGWRLLLQYKTGTLLLPR